VHRLGRPPWDTHLGGDLLPHLVLEPGNVSQHAERRKLSVQYVPSIEPRKLVLLLFVPYGSLLQVVLIAQSARNRASPRKTFRNIVPLHALASQLDGEIVFFGCPLRLFLSGALICEGSL
jgi:hypothetical protein